MKIKEAVTLEITRIYQESGQVTPSAVLEAARPKSSPIHDAFEWSNVKAAEEYRLWQARQWIRRVEIIVEDRPERLVHVPIIQHDTREGFYKPAAAMLDDEFAVALRETAAKLQAVKRAYHDLKMAAGDRAKGGAFRRADRGFALVESGLGRAAL